MLGALCMRNEAMNTRMILTGLIGSALAVGLVAMQAHPSLAQAQTLDIARTQAMTHTAFPQAMGTYQNCLGDRLVEGVTGAAAQAGCQTLAVHVVQQTQGQGAVAAFLRELPAPPPAAL